MTLQNRTWESVRRHGLIKRGDLVLVAVSGGADSVALLSLLGRLAPLHGFSIAVAHLNHMIRGGESDRDAAFVRKLARDAGLRAIMGRHDVPALARRAGMSLEAAARKARYAFLAEAARKLNATTVATAHTADDQAETVLMRLFRGAGPRGLAGIPRRNTLDNTIVIRPLLDARRIEIEEFLQGQGATWVEDSSNASPEHMRNRVRHEVLPLLERRINPDVRDALCRTAEVMHEEDLFSQEIADALAASANRNGDLQAAVLKTAASALRRRVIRTWLENAGVPPDTGSGFQAVLAVDRILTGATKRPVQLADNWHIGLKSGRLHAWRSTTEREPARAAPAQEHLQVPCRRTLAGLGVSVDVTMRKGIVMETGLTPGHMPSSCSLEPSAVAGRKLAVRPWRPGDRISPFGMRGTKKVQDIFTDAKVPENLRHSIPIVTVGKEIAWIPGYRIARRFAVKDPSQPCIHITLTRESRKRSD